VARGGGRLSERISLAIAIAIHVAAFAVARRVAVREVGAQSAAVAEIDLEVEQSTPTPHAPRDPRPEAPLAPASPHPQPLSQEGRGESARLATPLPSWERGLGAEGPRVAEGPRATSAGPREETSAASQSEAPASTTPSVEPRPSPPSVSLAQLGIDGPNRFVEAPGGASTWTIHEAEDGVRRSIAESLLKHDRAVGLGAEGPAIAAIEETVVASTASVNGRAVLSLVADALGVVTGVSCIDGDHAHWYGIAADIAKALAKKRLRGVPGGRGVEMRIEVTSREEMPSGRDPGMAINVLGLPVKKGRGPKSAHMDLLAVNPKIVIDDTGEEGEGPQAEASPVKFPKAHIQLFTLFGLDYDLVDIAAPARRVVHAHVLEEHPL